MKCFDLLVKAMNKASENDATINWFEIDKARELCSIVDDMYGAFGGEKCVVEIKRDSYIMHVFIECDEIISENEENPLIKALKLSDRVLFSHGSSGETIRIDFELDLVL